MTDANKLNSIVTKIQSQLLVINGSGIYNNTVTESNIKLGYHTPNNLEVYPAICIAGATCNSHFADQITSNQDIEVSLIAYHKGEFDLFTNALKLLSDMENAIMSDETIGGFVYELSYAS